MGSAWGKTKALVGQVISGPVRVNELCAIALLELYFKMLYFPLKGLVFARSSPQEVFPTWQSSV